MDLLIPVLQLFFFLSEMGENQVDQGLDDTILTDLILVIFHPGKQSCRFQAAGGPGQPILTVGGQIWDRFVVDPLNRLNGSRLVYRDFVFSQMALNAVYASSIFRRVSVQSSISVLCMAYILRSPA